MRKRKDEEDGEPRLETGQTLANAHEDPVEDGDMADSNGPTGRLQEEAALRTGQPPYL